jgi:O-antigen ligase
MSVRASQQSNLSQWQRGFGVASGPDLLLVPFLGVLLLARVLTDDRSAPDSRHSGGLNLSAGIAVLFILVAGGLLLRRRHGVLPTALAILWLCVWTVVALNTSGASTETLREGVREASVIALAAIVYNARGTVTVPLATRLVQLVGLAPALLALYQLASHTGMDVGGYLRANGTFAHPNSAVMFFAIAATASLWRYLDYGRHHSDALLVALFAAAVVSTFSLDGLLTLFAMMVAFGALHPGPLRVKLVPYLVGGLVVLVFFATPLGTQRIVSESSTSLAAGEPSTSLSWRINKWETLLPEWEQSPVFGQGLGTTTTAENTLAAPFGRYPPHNEYVRYIVETGILGMAILLVGLTILVVSLFRKRKIPGSVDAGTFNAPSLGIVIIVGCLVNSLADNTILDTPTSYAAALIIASVLAYPVLSPAPSGRQTLTS